MKNSSHQCKKKNHPGSQNYCNQHISADVLYQHQDWQQQEMSVLFKRISARLNHEIQANIMAFQLKNISSSSFPFLNFLSNVRQNSRACLRDKCSGDPVPINLESLYQMKIRPLPVSQLSKPLIKSKPHNYLIGVVFQTGQPTMLSAVHLVNILAVRYQDKPQ